MSDAARRIVTGHSADGTSIVVSDGPVPNVNRVADGAAFHEIWATAATPAPISATEAEPTASEAPVPPPPHGSRMRIVDFPPGARSPMHRTETIDYGIVLAGELVLLLDDGSETALGVGDVVVQRGTDHAWHNSSSGSATMAFVLVDAEFGAALAKSLPEAAVDNLMSQPPAP